MAYFASKKASQVATKLQYIAAIELMTGIQGLDFLLPLNPSIPTKSIYSFIREKVLRVEEDRFFHPDIEKIHELIKSGKIIQKIEQIMGKLKF